jgi:PPM family protein phosphatase
MVFAQERTVARYRSAAHTDVGMKRAHNEDSFLVNERLGLYTVCDGMGGHKGGETASRLAAQTIERELLAAKKRGGQPFRVSEPLERSPLAGALREAMEKACAAVFRKSLRDPELQGMGTTCIALLVHGESAIVGHVGDSRAYLVRGGALTQLSEDHSLVNEQVRAGLITPAEAKVSRLRNIITRSVGFEEEVNVDVIGVATRPGDKFLLCSDGLSNLVGNAEIKDHLLLHPLDQVPPLLVQLANRRGGDDNSTVIAVERVDG